MKTSENKLNEALRSALKRKFDNFENAPDPSAFEKIRAHIKPAPQWKYLFFSLLFVGLAITGIMTDQHFRQKSVGKVHIKGGGEMKNNIAEVVMKEASVIKSSTLEPARVEPVSVKITSRKLNATNPEAVKPMLIKPTFAELKLGKATLVGSASIEATSTKQVFEEPALSKSGSNEATLIEPVLSKSSVEPTLTEPAPDNNLALISNANVLDNQPYKFSNGHYNLPDIDIPKDNVKPVVRARPGQFNWLVNAAILQSYQILTVPAGGQSFQNFEFPSTFSLHSLGYKVSVGAEKKGFQFMLHYSRFEQSYSYEIAGNDYIVQTANNGKFVVIRQGTRVSQENKFSLLGIGVNKQVQWGNASVGKYYASAGLQYSYGMIRKQSIGWVNAGIGKQFPISKNTSLHIGPYAEFSPVKFTGSGDPFFYQPYRVGVSAGLRIGR